MTPATIMCLCALTALLGFAAGYMYHKHLYVHEHAEEISQALERALAEEEQRLREEYAHVYYNMLSALMEASQMVLSTKAGEEVTVDIVEGNENE